jgi:hypothetical protein
MIARRNMRCLITADKHINNTLAIAWQPPVARIEKPLEAVFSVESAPELYSEDPRPAEVCSVVGYSPDSNDVNTKAGESSLLRSVTRK